MLSLIASLGEGIGSQIDSRGTVCCSLMREGSCLCRQEARVEMPPPPPKPEPVVPDPVPVASSMQLNFSWQQSRPLPEPEPEPEPPPPPPPPPPPKVVEPPPQAAPDIVIPSSPGVKPVPISKLIKEYDVPALPKSDSELALHETFVHRVTFMLRTPVMFIKSKRNDSLSLTRTIIVSRDKSVRTEDHTT